MIKKIITTVILIAVILIGMRPSGSIVSAAPAEVTFSVNSTDDLVDSAPGDGKCLTTASTCTLRAAIMEANRTSAPAATIDLPAGIYLLIIPAVGADGEENGDLDITTGSNTLLTIRGAGASTTTIDAQQLDRVLHVHSPRNVLIDAVSFRNGLLPLTSMQTGGGILNEGDLSLDQIIISNNSSSLTGGGITNTSYLYITRSQLTNNSSKIGGGIYNRGTKLTILDSAISQNNSGSGGGIYNDSLSTLIVTSSTISGNVAMFGGGIFNRSGLTVVNSTFVQNTAGKDGGGIDNDSGTANVYNTSVLFNHADTSAQSGRGGGVFNNGGVGVGAVFNMRNTLIAGNTITNDQTYSDCEGVMNLYGKNLFWKTTYCTISGTGGGSYTYLNGLNFLGPLQNNGGPTPPSLF